MRLVQKDDERKQGKIYYEQFNSYQEFLDKVEERDKNNSHGSHRLEGNAEIGEDWCGVHNYQEARNLLTKGWDAKVEYFKSQFEKASKEVDEKKVVKQFSDVVGFIPIVPNVLIGVPNCMINRRVENKKSKVIKFLIDTDVSCGVNSDKIIKYYSKVLARIATLEKKGYRCRIEVFQSFTQEYNDRTNAMLSVLIKSENQPFDIKRMAFPLAHTAMFRVFGFGWENSLPIDYDSYHFGGLGVPMYHWSKKGRDNILNPIKEGNEKMIYISYKMDLDEVFGKEVV